MHTTRNFPEHPGRRPPNPFRLISVPSLLYIYCSSQVLGYSLVVEFGSEITPVKPEFGTFEALVLPRWSKLPAYDRNGLLKLHHRIMTVEYYQWFLRGYFCVNAY